LNADTNEQNNMRVNIKFLKTTVCDFKLQVSMSLNDVNKKY